MKHGYSYTGHDQDVKLLLYCLPNHMDTIVGVFFQCRCEPHPPKFSALAIHVHKKVCDYCKYMPVNNNLRSTVFFYTKSLCIP